MVSPIHDRTADLFAHKRRQMQFAALIGAYIIKGAGSSGFESDLVSANFWSAS